MVGIQWKHPEIPQRQSHSSSWLLLKEEQSFWGNAKLDGTNLKAWGLIVTIVQIVEFNADSLFILYSHTMHPAFMFFLHTFMCVCLYILYVVTTRLMLSHLLYQFYPSCKFNGHGNCWLPWWIILFANIFPCLKFSTAVFNPWQQLQFRTYTRNGTHQQICEWCQAHFPKKILIFSREAIPLGSPTFTASDILVWVYRMFWIFLNTYRTKYQMF